MPLLRLIGLALLITAFFLALAAAITKTTHIHVQLPGTASLTQQVGQSDQSILPPSIQAGLANEISESQSTKSSFNSIPIVVPLIIAAGTGLLMWFISPGDTLRTPSARKRRRR